MAIDGSYGKKPDYEEIKQWNTELSKAQQPGNCLIRDENGKIKAIKITELKDRQIAITFNKQGELNLDTPEKVELANQLETTAAAVRSRYMQEHEKYLKNEQKIPQQQQHPNIEDQQRQQQVMSQVRTPNVRPPLNEAQIPKNLNEQINELESQINYMKGVPYNFLEHQIASTTVELNALLDKLPANELKNQINDVNSKLSTPHNRKEDIRLERKKSELMIRLEKLTGPGKSGFEGENPRPQTEIQKFMEPIRVLRSDIESMKDDRKPTNEIARKEEQLKESLAKLPTDLRESRIKELDKRQGQFLESIKDSMRKEGRTEWNESEVEDYNGVLNEYNELRESLVSSPKLETPKTQKPERPPLPTIPQNQKTQELKKPIVEVSSGGDLGKAEAKLSRLEGEHEQLKQQSDTAEKKLSNFFNNPSDALIRTILSDYPSDKNTDDMKKKLINDDPGLKNIFDKNTKGGRTDWVNVKTQIDVASKNLTQGSDKWSIYKSVSEHADHFARNMEHLKPGTNVEEVKKAVWKFLELKDLYRAKDTELDEARSEFNKLKRSNTTVPPNVRPVKK